MLEELLEEGPVGRYSSISFNVDSKLHRDEKDGKPTSPYDITYYLFTIHRTLPCLLCEDPEEEEGLSSFHGGSPS